MTNADDTHFDTYRHQTRVKHQLLTGYLPAYLSILQTANPRIMYIDGFAGRGHYETPNGPVQGSPLLAISLLAQKEEYRTKVACFFNEENKSYYESLKNAVELHPATSLMTIKPVVNNMKFSDFMKYMSSYFATNGVRQAPMFLFVDPCGLSDVRMSDLVDVLSRPGCELFLFLNYDGLKRIIGLAQNSSISPTLSHLYGSQQSVDELVAKISGRDARQKEQIIVAHFIEALKVASGAMYVLPFNIEHEVKRMTSHYLIHATKNATGFRIMKTVMHNAAKASGSDTCLRLLQASDGGMRMMFDSLEVANMKHKILNEVQCVARVVRLFAIEWAERPDDLFSTEEYKQAILELEQEGKIVVLNKNGDPYPQSKRLRKGKLTLGETCLVRLPEKAL